MKRNKVLESYSLIDVAQLIRKRPRMWLRKISLLELDTFLSGFSYGCKVISIPPFEYFGDFVRYQYKEEGRALSYTHFIMQHCEGDEEKAFYTFYELLDEFLEVSPKAIYKTNLTEDNFELYYSRKHTCKPYRCLPPNRDEKVLFPAPYHIKLVEFQFATFIYYYGFSYVVGDGTIEEGEPFLSSYDSVQKAKDNQEAFYGHLVWEQVEENNLKKEFKKIVLNT